MARTHPRDWKYSSPDQPGLHVVVSPDNSPCAVTWIFRLNLEAGQSYRLRSEQLELNGLVIAGSARIQHSTGRARPPETAGDRRSQGEESADLGKFDSFYLPGGDEVEITATADLAMYIGGGPYEGVGSFYVRPLDLSLPLGDVHQIHGRPPYQREVFMTVNPEVPASRMINGITWGQDGRWTSWPPHQHTADLEEVYCYMDLDPPKFALHLSSRVPGTIEAVHPVSTGDCVIVPEGYHPTVSMPGAQSCYFWVMVAHSRASRRYDLAVDDPSYKA